jgi:hypothetical protein
MLMTTMVEDPEPDEQRTPFSASELTLAPFKDVG